MQTVGTILGAVLTAYVAVATISLLIRTHLLKQRERLSLDLLRQQMTSTVSDPGAITHELCIQTPRCRAKCRLIANHR